MNSYFSPIGDSPSSSSIRSSSQSGSMTPLPYRGQPTPTNGSRGYENSKHNTAPPGTYHQQERQHPRPPLSHSAMQQQQQQQSQSRARSLSSSDIHHHHPNSPGKRHMNGHTGPSPDEVPVPPIPSHMRAPINRSQTSSPTENPRYPRSQTPGGGGYGYPQAYGGRESHSRSNSRQGHHYPGPGPTSYSMGQRVASPAMVQANPQGDDAYISQLRVKVFYELKSHQSHVTIVVPINIKYQTLIDRIDAKMQKIFPTISIGSASARIRYVDEDGVYLLIQNDEDVHMALDEWKDNQANVPNGNISDLELYWQQKERFRG